MFDAAPEQDGPGVIVGFVGEAAASDPALLSAPVEQTAGMDDSPAPPPGATWTGEWNTDYDDRVFGADPVAVGNAAVLLTGVQHRSGATVSGVALRIRGAVVPDRAHPAVTVDLTPTQARELADMLITLASHAEALDGLTDGSDCREPALAD